MRFVSLMVVLDHALNHAHARVRASGANFPFNEKDVTLFWSGQAWISNDFGVVEVHDGSDVTVTSIVPLPMLMGPDSNFHSAETDAIASTPPVAATAPAGTGWHNTKCYLTCNIQTQ